MDFLLRSKVTRASFIIVFVVWICIKESMKEPSSNIMVTPGPVFAMIPPTVEPTSTVAPPPSIVTHAVTPDSEYFKDILVLIMTSPARFSVIPAVLENYGKGFPNIIVYGPRNHTFEYRGAGYRVVGMHTVFGNLQYVAMMDAMTTYAHLNFTGYLFCNDDMMLHFWSLKSHNKTRAWTSQRGIGYLGSTGLVKSVSGMSYELSHRGVWPFWRQGVRIRLASVLRTAGADARKSLAEATSRTSSTTKHESVFQEGNYPSIDRNYREFCVFYTVVDAYYVPASYTYLFLKYITVFRNKFIHQELAVPSALAMVDRGSYETLRINYYWAKHKAKDCSHPGWREEIDGFHRCMHDTEFAKWLYHGREKKESQPEWKG